MHNYIQITSKDNQLIKFVAELQSSSKKRQSGGFFVLEGLRICIDAYDNGIEFNKLIVTENALSKHSEIIEKFNNNSENCYIMPETLFKKISDTNTPQGIIAVAKIPKIKNIISSKGKYIALENISDPSNLGAIARTAEALGVSGIILSSGGCDPYSPKSLRASMGTLLRMPIYIADNIMQFINKNSLRSIACVVDGNAKKITEVKFNSGDVLLIGNEANGLTDNTKKTADLCVTIPMTGKSESLNAAAAAAIAMWEMMK